MKRNLRQRKAFYRLQREAAKEAYKKRTGLVIARGFKDSPESKRVDRNEKRSLNRLRKREVQEKAIEKPKGGIGRPKKDPIKIREKVEVKQKFFWEVLTMNDGDSENAIQLWRQAEQESGKIPGFTLFGIIVDYDGKRSVYVTEFQFARALSKLARAAAKLQEYEIVKDDDGKKRRKTTYYPMVNLEVAEESVDENDDNNIVYIIVEGVK